ncbi:ABC transporter permease [Arthrobacter sp. M4]|uniref:ABC transporter permease n=1 Tax=Arthrobacter sp. M4 TaxID=218160 RepID=UPI001CDCA44E|nr:ABC transporter permease [Arthrobacter sp. M4]MCA4132566.1 ABC transporter permease [Arthrobacter sp. M4]
MTDIVGPSIPAGTPQAATARRGHTVYLRVERLVGLVIEAALALAFIIVPVASPISSSDITSLPLAPPSAEHLFGTDQLGRDIFVRTFEAGRIDLGLILVSIAAAAVGGALLGLFAAYLPPIGRMVISRVTDATMAFPYIVLVIGLAAALGNRELISGLPRGAAAISIAVVIACWPPYTRLTLSRALVLRERDSIIAARVLGYGPMRILFSHIGPALVPTVVSYAATQAVATTALVGSLAFLGVGIAPPTPELGQMMAENIALLPVAWWPSIIPGVVVLILGVGFALMADSTSERNTR